MDLYCDSYAILASMIINLYHFRTKWK